MPERPQERYTGNGAAVRSNVSGVAPGEAGNPRPTQCSTCHKEQGTKDWRMEKPTVPEDRANYSTYAEEQLLDGTSDTFPKQGLHPPLPADNSTLAVNVRSQGPQYETVWPKEGELPRTPLESATDARQQQHVASSHKNSFPNGS